MPKYLDYHGLETLTNDIDTTYVKKSQKGAANGIASLDNSGKVPASQLPDLESLPAGGTAGQVLAKATNTDYDVEWVNQSGGGGQHNISFMSASAIEFLYNVLNMNPTAYYKIIVDGDPNTYHPNVGDILIIRATQDLTLPQTEAYRRIRFSIALTDGDGNETRYSVDNSLAYYPDGAAGNNILNANELVMLRYRAASTNLYTFDIIGKHDAVLDYSDIQNKPKINDVELAGNKTLSDLGVYNVPSGGSTNQVLAKNSGTDYDLKWMTVSGGGSGSFAANYVTPEDYGAVGDGTTDDTTAISQAFNSGMPVVMTKDKLYKITQIEISQKPLTVYGNGATITTTSIENAQNVVPLITVRSGEVMYDIVVRDVNFYTTADQTIHGAHPNDPEIPNRSVRSGFLCYGVSRLIIENCHFTNFDNPIRGTRTSSDTAYTYIPQDTWIINCQFDNALMGILGFFKNFHLTGCKFAMDPNAQSGEHGIYLLMDAMETASITDTTILTHDGACGSCIQFYPSSLNLTLPTLSKREYKIDSCFLIGDSYISNVGGGKVYASNCVMKTINYSTVNRRRQFECAIANDGYIEVINSTVNLELQDGVSNYLIFRDCDIYSNKAITNERFAFTKAYNCTIDNIGLRVPDGGEYVNCTFSSSLGVTSRYYVTAATTTTSSRFERCSFESGTNVNSIAYAYVGTGIMIDIISSLPNGTDNTGLTIYHKIDPTQSDPGGGSGTTNYNDLTNKPQIGGITLSGNKTLNDLGIHNIPSGGSTNQVLAKNSGTNYDLKWVTVSGGGSSSGTYSGLEGKNVIFFGDSISYGEGNNGHSYIDIIDEMGICASLVKEAHTSSCVGPYNVYSDANGYDLISMIQLRATDIANADIVFCAYCGNDSDSLAHNLIQLGYPEESSTANTICGYTRRAIENIRAINPLVRIVWLFARMSNFTFLRDPTSTSYVSADYLIPTVKAMSEVCSDNNVTYGSQYDGLYLDKQHGHILNDIAGHPTELGHTLIAETILHEYPFSVRPYEPVKHVTLNNDGTYNSTFAVLLLHAQHDIDIFVHYQGLVFRQKAYSSSGLLFESEGMASSSASTRYLLSITSSGASLYTTSSALTSVPWGGGGGGGDGVIYDGSVTIMTDAGGVNYCTINTSEPISADETWTVVWNGTTYTLQSKYVTTLGPSDLNAYCIGNVDIEDGGDDGSGVPFYAYKYQANVMAFGTTDPTGTITLRVVKGSSGSSDYVTYFDGNVTVMTDNPSYFVINNYTYPFGANETYRITWDTGGTQYTCTTRQAGGGQAFDGYGIGNAGLAGGTDTGEPFLMYRDSATRLASVTNHAAGTVHVKIEKYVGSSGA